MSVRVWYIVVLIKSFDTNALVFLDNSATVEEKIKKNKKEKRVLLSTHTVAGSVLLLWNNVIPFLVCLASNQHAKNAARRNQH